ncbi:SDR family oxidoreductase [Rhodococcus sp. Eu-32]|uniref:SDR family oxidoreductase n=1 Tax=Rhodococcus sp. Eu-32 TaxID=1017319 RepID=UPI000DF4296D|nr:SDR family oxidoreductase [Rhodococcus sp. Eu-32]RRQ28996.1 SDR family oxidoreductase [Rhodococcus sp. Eu-32]
MSSREVPAHRRFEGKVAVVTGASRGIGLSIASRLADGGASVVMNARKPDVLKRAVEAVVDAGGHAVGVAGSIDSATLPGELVDAAVSSFGHLDLIVNNAATSASYGPLMDVSREAFHKTVLANTWPAVALVQKAVAHGMTNGSVVNILTTGAERVHPVTGPYTASKAALASLTNTLAHELGPRNIRVNAVAPGLVRTDLARALWDGERGPQEERLVPLGRLGEPDDIASAVCFLLSDDAEWITGAMIRVDGGRIHVGGEPADMIGAYR